jgi:hypothetical protein
MARRLGGRLAQWLFRVGVALALLSDAPQQLELTTHTSGALTSLGAHLGPVDARGPAPAPQGVARAATVVVNGVAWLAVMSLPYAEPYSDP